MDVRWMAVITGFTVDYLITGLIILFANPAPDYFSAPDITRPAHLLLIALGLLSTGVGGFVAGRMSRTRQALHGLLVGAVGIIISELNLLTDSITIPRVFVIASAVGCLVGALGGLASMIGAGKAEGRR